MIPKFRAFYENEMRDVLRLSFEDKRVKLGNVGFLPTKYVKLDEVFLMQSTGLFDKNGQEIFEGDVVMWVRDESELVGVVAYDNKLGFWGMTDKRFKADDLTAIGYIANQDVEVIGNIWEDGDLIDNKKSETD